MEPELNCEDRSLGQGEKTESASANFRGGNPFENLPKHKIDLLNRNAH